MSYSDPYTTSPFDQVLAATCGLTWVPWVGENYAEHPPGRRILIVGESHYAGGDDAEKAMESVAAIEEDKEFTRFVVHDSLILSNWSTRTLSAMHELFHAPENRHALWSNVCFYNFIQKSMNYTGNSRERPHWRSFYDAWGVFLKVIDILHPDHVLFVGVEASNHFGNYMAGHTITHSPVSKIEKVGSTYARTAEVSLNNRSYPIHFIKHCGKCFPTHAWSDYLHRNAGGLMASIAAFSGAVLPTEH